MVDVVSFHSRGIQRGKEESVARRLGSEEVGGAWSQEEPNCGAGPLPDRNSSCRGGRDSGHMRLNSYNIFFLKRNKIKFLIYNPDQHRTFITTGSGKARPKVVQPVRS